MKIFLKILTRIFILLFVIAIAAFVMLPLPGTIPILMYHFIDTSERAAAEKNVVSRDSFENQMKFLKKFNYRVITLDEYYDIQRGKRKPLGREIVITFDDGNYTYADQAFPILKKYNFPSAQFLVSESVKNKLQGSMDEATVKQLLTTGLVTIGSHSQTHPALSTLTDAQMKKELIQSKKDLEKMFGVPIYYLAYPSGDVDERVIGVVKEAEYRLAFTTSYKKLKGLEEGLYTLSRIKITRTSDNLFAYWFQISGIYQVFKEWLYRLKNS